MIKRTSLVWRRPDISTVDFRRLWLGEHATLATQLAGLKEYVIDFAPETEPEGPAGIATLRFESLAALENAFRDAPLKARLMRTRDEFASKVQIMLVDEVVVLPRQK